MNYGELKTALAGFSHRSDLTSVIPTFIQLAQARIGVRVRAPEMITRVTLDDTERNSDGTYDLPADYAQVIEITGTRNGMPYALESEPIQALYSYAITGSVLKYAIWNSYIEFRAVPGAGTEWGLTYYKKEAALSADVDTTSLLTAHPALYIDGALVELHKYTQDLELSQDALNRFEAYTETLNSASNRARGRMSAAGPYNFAPRLTGNM